MKFSSPLSEKNLQIENIRRRENVKSIFLFYFMYLSFWSAKTLADDFASKKSSLISSISSFPIFSFPLILARTLAGVKSWTAYLQHKHNNQIYYNRKKFLYPCKTEWSITQNWYNLDVEYSSGQAIYALVFKDSGIWPNPSPFTIVANLQR